MAKGKNEFVVRFRLEDDGSLKQVGQQAEKTGKQVKRGVTKEAHSADRAMKGLSKQSSNATKNFSKMSQGLAGGIVPIYATLAAQVFAVSAAFQFLKEAADYRVLLEGQRAFGIATGVAYKSLARIIGDATDGQITYAAASEAAAIGIASGLSPGQLEKLATAAKRVSIALGRDLTDSFNRLVRGATKAEPELLDELGIVLRLDPALKKYADAIGKTKEQLTAFQRTQAVTNEILEQAETKYAAIEAIMEPSINQLNVAAVAFDEMLNSFKLWLAGPVEKIATFFSKNMMAGVSIVALFAYSIIRNMLPSIKSWQAGLAEAAIEHKANLNQMKADLHEYQMALAATQAQSRGSFAAGMGVQQGRARGLDSSTYAAGGGMALLATGGIPSKRQLGALKGQLKRGVGPFSDKALGGDPKVAKKIRAEWDKTFKSMDKNIKGTGRSYSVMMDEAKLKSKIAGGSIKNFFNPVKGVFMSIAKWGLRIFRIFTIIGIGTMLIPPLVALGKTWFGIGEGTDEATSSLEKYIQQQRSLVAEITEFKDNAEEVMKMGYFAWLAQRGKSVTQLRIGDTYDKWLEARERFNKQQGIAQNMGTQAQIMSGTAPRQMGAMGVVQDWWGSWVGREVAGVASQDIEAVVTAKNEFKDMTVEMVKTFELAGELDREFQQYYDTIMRGGDLNKEQLEDMGRLVQIYQEGTTAIAQHTEAVNKMVAARGKYARPSLGSRDSYLVELNALGRNLQAQMNLANVADVKDTQAIADLTERIRRNEEARKEILRIIADEYRAINMVANAKLEQTILKGSVVASTEYGKKQMKILKLAEGRGTLLKEETKLKDHLNKVTTEMNSVELARHNQETNQLQDTINLQKQKNTNLELSVNNLHNIKAASIQAFDQGLQQAIMGVVDGTKSMKEGFLEMTRAVLVAIAQIIIKLIAMKAVEKGAMMFGFADGGVIPRASGGYMGTKRPRGYRSGGVVTDPTYLVGEGRYNEAVVPLPDGRSIPVEMKGGASNVVVNVNVAANGQSTSNLSQNGGQGAAHLGRAISVAVTEELYKQKRPGGALSPWGG